MADTAGFAPAARTLQMSPPAVTRAIAALEKRLGILLFHRTTRQVRLTAAGIRFLEDCRRILADLSEAKDSATGAHQEPRGRLSITASMRFGYMYVAPLLLEFLERYPEVSVQTLFVDRVVNLLEEGLDVAVRIGPLPDSSLTAIRVGTVRRVVCGAPAYLEARGIPWIPEARHRIPDWNVPRSHAGVRVRSNRQPVAGALPASPRRLAIELGADRPAPPLLRIDPNAV